MITEIAAVDKTGNFNLDVLNAEKGGTAAQSYLLFDGFYKWGDIVGGAISFYRNSLIQDSIKRTEESCVQKKR